jgi:hypothetical protein
MSVRWEIGGKVTNDEDELELVEEDPLDGITVLFKGVFCGPAFDEGIAYERVDGSPGRLCEVGSCRGEGAGPEDDTAC